MPEKDQPKVPVPVMFTMHGWDPNTRRVQDWLTARLRETYPLFAGKGGAADAAALIGAGKVAVILDGLDEIPEELRPAALRALNQQAAADVRRNAACPAGYMARGPQPVPKVIACMPYPYRLGDAVAGLAPSALQDRQSGGVSGVVVVRTDR